MSIETRLLKSDEIEKAMQLWSYCFADSPEFISWYFKMRAGEVFAALDGTDLAAQMVAVPLVISLRDKKSQAMMLSGVATAPQHRGKGYMNMLMRDGLSYLRDIGTEMALLSVAMNSSTIRCLSFCL